MANEIDIAVVGGGIAGLYCVLKLAQDAQLRQTIRSIALFEASTRFGGWICTEHEGTFMASSG